ncbi:sensor histidine kinase [Nonomuraea sp. NPDC047897]|uniref:sensor histidine kinase n=1 Tax=Nonomuraea sp. NPDC047897 TaxID=3364346 RepID=UPI0037145C3B
MFAVPPSPLWPGGVVVTAGAVALAVTVQAGLAGSRHALAGSVVLWVLVALHVAFALLMTGRHGGRRWPAGVQACLTYLPLPFLGATWTPVCGLLSGALFMTACRTRSPLLAAQAVACGPVLLWAPAGTAHPGWAIAAPVLGLVECALVGLAARAHRLTGVRDEAIGRAVALERRRFTRDLHDLVGHRLAVLVLKAQLVQRLVDERDDKAGLEVAETLDLLRALAADVRAVAHGGRRSSLEEELASARALLESVGVRCRVRASCRDLTGEVGEALTHALREGVTNILRHANARHCAIDVAERDGRVHLSMRSDGARPPRRDGDGTAGLGPGPGQGLANLTERVALVGGRLEVNPSRGGEFAFTVHVPRADDDAVTGH